MNELALKARLGSIRRLLPLSAALLLAALLAIPSSNLALAQAPGLSLVNEDEDFIERKDDGRFIARPLFRREIEVLYYGVPDADTGDWITGMYRVQGGEKKRSDGWEYSWEYPDLDDHPYLDRDLAYLLVNSGRSPSGRIRRRMLKALEVTEFQDLFRLEERDEQD